MPRKFIPSDVEIRDQHARKLLAKQARSAGRAGVVEPSALEPVAAATQQAEAAGHILVEHFLEQTRALGLEPDNELHTRWLRRPLRSSMRSPGYDVLSREPAGRAWYLGLVAGDYFYLCPDGRRAVTEEIVLSPVRPSLLDRLRGRRPVDEDVRDGWRFEPVLGCLPEDLRGGVDPLGEAMDRYLIARGGTAA